MQIGSIKWKKLLYDGARDLEIQVDSDKVEKFTTHAVELAKWNQKMNLTAITDPMEVAVKHFLDSMAPDSIIPPNASLLDIGSGGGFPGIPLKILRPSLSVTLIDASRKKVSFLKHIIRVIGLENIEAFHVRSEEFSKQPVFAGAFNAVISRALSSTPEFVLTALPLLEKNGIIIAMKGKRSKAEIELMRSLIHKKTGMRDENQTKIELRLKTYMLPYLKIERSIVTIKRVRGDMDRLAARH
jgi:16S rRNA (guanine527-N7)-methyltransferase